MTIPLFIEFPQLESALGYESMSTLPTPVHSLNNIGYENAWIKRDDLTNEEYGGNKLRKLEFIIPEVKKQGKNHVITFGAIGTNAGVATAMVCAKHNIKCTVLLFDQPISETVKKNLSLMNHYGADLVYKGSLLKTALSFYLSPLRLSPSAYFLFAGCSNPAATFAYVNAALELRGQIRQGLCPEPSAIHLPVGSSSTLAGLTLGVKLAGLKTKVIGTRVAPSHVGFIPSCTPKLVDKMIEQCYGTLSKLTKSVLPFRIPKCTMLEDQYGEGYGETTDAANHAIHLMRDKESIPLEPTYSGKAFASFLENLKKTNEPVLFWDTFNSNTIPNYETHSLPPNLQDIIRA